MKETIQESPIISKRRIIQDLLNLGICPGQTVMLHVSVRALGWVVGGPDTVLQAILDLLTEEGTLIMMVSWEDNPYHLSEWSKEKQIAYLEECPPFSPATSRAARKYSILTEYLRTRSGSYRSDHPENSFAAIGRLARWITQNHPLNYGYGPGSPLAKLCEAGGKVLMLGAPLNTITLLHYAEHMANVSDKRIARYRMPVLRNGNRAWIEIEEYDTSKGIVDWPEGDYFPLIVSEYLSSGKGVTGKVGSAQSNLFDAADLVRFAVQWMEIKFRP
jgi:aminoglycoside 3-N-acetyltransferase